MSKYLLLLTLTKEKQIKIRYQLRKNNTNGVAKSLHFQFLFDATSHNDALHNDVLRQRFYLFGRFII